MTAFQNAGVTDHHMMANSMRQSTLNAAILQKDDTLVEHSFHVEGTEWIP